MKFTIYYRGPLRANAGPHDKLAIRRQIHPQLVRLWQTAPLAPLAPRLLNRDDPANCLLSDVGQYHFGCVVGSKLRCTAELDITLLRPEPPGSLVAQGGDIDNRLKTLLDALSIPSNPEAIPAAFVQGEAEDPLFCLLQDDALVTSLRVGTEHWLDPAAPGSPEVVLLIRVTTGTTQLQMNNLEFA